MRRAAFFRSFPAPKKRPLARAAQAAQAALKWLAQNAKRGYSGFVVSPFKRAILTVCLVAFLVTGAWSLTQNRFRWQKLILLEAYSHLTSALDTLHEKTRDIGGQSVAIDTLQVQVIHLNTVRVITEPSEFDGSQRSAPFSDRAELTKLIAAVAAQKPKAIGIDIDFSSPDGKSRSSQDGKFFDYLLSLNPPGAKTKKAKAKKGVPVYLGVFNLEATGGAYFLGVPRYDALAAAISGSADDTLYIPILVGPRENRLPSLAYALAFGNNHTPPPFSIRNKSDDTEQILVNYSELEHIQSRALVNVTPETIPEYASYIKDRYILIGDAQEPRNKDDVFRIPGQKSPVPGIFLHACALYTLLQEPVWEPSLLARLVLNATLTICVPALLFFAMRLSKKSEAERAGEGDEFLSRAAEGVVLLGIILVLWQRLFWFDFLLISLVFKTGAFVFKWLLSHRHSPHPTETEAS